MTWYLMSEEEFETQTFFFFFYIFKEDHLVMDWQVSSIVVNFVFNCISIWLQPEKFQLLQCLTSELLSENSILKK